VGNRATTICEGAAAEGGMILVEGRIRPVGYRPLY